MISFKGKHYPKDVILFAVFFYLRYAVSYHDLEEIMQERGVDVDHATLNRWVIEYVRCWLMRLKNGKRRPHARGEWMRLTVHLDPDGPGCICPEC